MYFFVVERGYLLGNHSNDDLSVCLGHHIFFSHVRKILEGSCFHPVVHLVFHWALIYSKIRFFSFSLNKNNVVHYEFNILLELYKSPLKPSKMIELKPVICFIRL